MALFVFGAGATRGCSFVEPTENPCLPFLDGDFFTQLQRVGSEKHQDLINQVVSDVIQLFGCNFDVTMETVFSTLEQMIEMLKVRGKATRGLKVADLEKMQKRLKQAIAVVFEESLTLHKGKLHRDPVNCEIHEKFVKNILKNKDNIISFNYDCTLDYSLKDFGEKKWNAQYGYGFKLKPRSSNLKGFDKWQKGVVAPKKTTVCLYKLHGSLHLYVKEEDLEEDLPNITLKERPYTKQRGNARFTIIPPEWHKRYDKGLFAHLWRKAGDAIANAKKVVIIGYSFPLTDLHATSLFKTSLKKDALQSLVIVNPDREARKRARTLLQRGLSENTKVISVDKFKEFVSINRGVWDI